MVELRNDHLEVVINPLGAELSGIRVDGEERQWSGDPRYWGGRAPVLFPICGALKNSTFDYEGKTYALPQHGFAKSALFSVESVTATTAVLCLTATSETKKSYPFDFVFRIAFTLSGYEIAIRFSVTNPSEKPLYFSVGSHEAFACPEGVSAYDIAFDQPETLPVYSVTGPLLDYQSRPFLTNQTTFPLKDEDFSIDALIFTGMVSDKVSLIHRATGKKVSVSFPGCTYLLLWTKPGAPYLCIEPWNGCPDNIDSDGDITHKPGILTAQPGETVERTHRISFTE